MPSATQELDLRSFLKLLRRRIWIIVFVPLVAAASAYIASDARTRMYRTDVDILIARSQAETLFDPLRGAFVDPTRLLANQARIIQSEDVAARARERLGYAAEISVAFSDKEDVITISAVDTDARRVAAVVKAFEQAYLDHRREAATGENKVAQDELRRQLADVAAQTAALDAAIAAAPADRQGPLLTEQGPQRQSLVSQQGILQTQLLQLQAAANVNRGGAEVLRGPVVPRKPFEPKPAQSGLLGLVVGLMLGLGVALLRDYLDDRIRAKEDLDAVDPNLPLLGQIPRLSSWKDRSVTHLASVEEPSSEVAEAYRSLRTSVQFLGVDDPLHILQVTSPTASEGKTTTVANLAVALARSGQRVIAVDCDLRRTRLATFFGLASDIGFTSLLLGEVTLSQAMLPVDGVERLWIVPAGPIPPNPSELLSGPHATSLLKSLADHADIVLVDSPPVLPVSDAAALAARVDGVLIVVNAGSTSRRHLHRAIEVLRQVEAPIVGTTLNGARGADSYSYGSAYKHAGREKGRLETGADRSSGNAHAEPPPSAPSDGQQDVPARPSRRPPSSSNAV